MTTASRLRAALYVCPVLMLLAGCAFPGSRIAKVGVTCRVIDADGRPVEGANLVVALPASYGLTGSDALFGTPATYGHRTMQSEGTTGADGTFAAEFATTHTMAFFIIPPIGSLLYRQTKPVVWLRIGGVPERVVTLQADGDGGLRVTERVPGSGEPLDGATGVGISGASEESEGGVTQ